MYVELKKKIRSKIASRLNSHSYINAWEYLMKKCMSYGVQVCGMNMHSLILISYLTFWPSYQTQLKKKKFKIGLELVLLFYRSTNRADLFATLALSSSSTCLSYFSLKSRVWRRDVEIRVFFTVYGLDGIVTSHQSHHLSPRFISLASIWICFFTDCSDWQRHHFVCHKDFCFSCRSIYAKSRHLGVLTLLHNLCF